MFNRRAPWHTVAYSLKVAILSISLVVGCGHASGNNKEDLTEKLALIELPPGFSIELYAVGVPNARAMTVGSNGTLFVGSRSKGNVYGIVDTDHNQQADKVFIIAQDLRAPAGVAIWQQSLYVSAVNKILRFDNIEKRLHEPPTAIVVTDQLPNENHHGWIEYLQEEVDQLQEEFDTHVEEHTDG